MVLDALVDEAVVMAEFRARVLALCNKLADADGYVTFQRWARLLLALMEKSPEDWDFENRDGDSAQRMFERAKAKALELFTDEREKTFNKEGEKMLASELVSILSPDLENPGSERNRDEEMSKLEAAVFAGDRVMRSSRMRLPLPPLMRTSARRPSRRRSLLSARRWLERARTGSPKISS
jgi:hypothetical protein